MKGKEKLIFDIIKGGIEGMQDFGNSQEEMLKDLRDNGYGDVHPFYRDEMKSGISYSHGYSVGHLNIAEHILELLKMSEDEIIALNAKNKEIEIENKETMDKMWKNIESRLDKNEE